MLAFPRTGVHARATPRTIDVFSSIACLSRPKDVVSGDFIWHHETTEHVFLAVADCTGHGVPGAMMSMLGNSLLNQMVLDRRLLSPQRILTEVDRALSGLFDQHRAENPVHDGMDIGLLMLDRNNLELTFAGALMRCLILRDGELIRLECSRHALGGCMEPEEKVFKQVRYQLRPGDRLVLSTDGYQSQFGGQLGKKMKADQFRSLIKRTALLSAPEGVAFLRREFDQWKGEEEQVDDVLIVMLDL